VRRGVVAAMTALLRYFERRHENAISADDVDDRFVPPDAASGDRDAVGVTSCGCSAYGFGPRCTNATQSPWFLKPN
jgi:hypothetical protein